MATPEAFNNYYGEEDTTLRKGGNPNGLDTTGQGGNVEGGNTTPPEPEQNDVNSIDESKDDVDEEKLAEFLGRLEDIQTYGTDRDKQQINYIMSQYDDDIKKILDKKDDDKSKKEREFEVIGKTDTELAEESNRIMSEQEKLEAQISIVKQIYEEGSPEDIKQLNDCIDKCMAKVESVWKSVSNDRKRNE